MKHSVRIQPLRWYGGKQAKGKADWIASLLPWSLNSVYVEPFGGMASVLARRAEVKCEIYNDLDGRVVNWFMVLRERTKEFLHLMNLSPHSREEYDRAFDMLNDEDDLRRAWAFWMVISQGLYPTTEEKYWVVAKNHNAGWPRPWKDERITNLVDRFKNVQFENRDAIELLEWVSKVKNAVIYCDPPYYSANMAKYQTKSVDIDKLERVLLDQEGKVAISGYGNEWDHLGWERSEFSTSIITAGANTIVEPRVEVVWTNYDVRSLENVGGLFDQL